MDLCDDIKEDMHKMEEDSKKIDCYAILDLILHCIFYKIFPILFFPILQRKIANMHMDEVR